MKLNQSYIQGKTKCVFETQDFKVYSNPLFYSKYYEN